MSAAGAPPKLSPSTSFAPGGPGIERKEGAWQAPQSRVSSEWQPASALRGVGAAAASDDAQWQEARDALKEARDACLQRFVSLACDEANGEVFRRLEKLLDGSTKDMREAWRQLCLPGPAYSDFLACLVGSGADALQPLLERGHPAATRLNNALRALGAFPDAGGMYDAKHVSQGLHLDEALKTRIAATIRDIDSLDASLANFPAQHYDEEGVVLRSAVSRRCRSRLESVTRLWNLRAALQQALEGKDCRARFLLFTLGADPKDVQICLRAFASFQLHFKHGPIAKTVELLCSREAPKESKESKEPKVEQPREAVRAPARSGELTGCAREFAAAAALRQVDDLSRLKTHLFRKTKPKLTELKKGLEALRAGTMSVAEFRKSVLKSRAVDEWIKLDSFKEGGDRIIAYDRICVLDDWLHKLAGGSDGLAPWAARDPYGREAVMADDFVVLDEKRAVSEVGPDEPPVRQEVPAHREDPPVPAGIPGGHNWPAGPAGDFEAEAPGDGPGGGGGGYWHGP